MEAKICSASFRLVEYHVGLIVIYCMFQKNAVYNKTDSFKHTSDL